MENTRTNTKKKEGIRIGNGILVKGKLGYNLVTGIAIAIGIIVAIAFFSIPGSIDAAQGLVPR